MNKKILLIPLFAFLAVSPFQCQEKKPGDGGLYQSQNRGESWQQLAVKDAPFTSLDALSIAIDSTDPEKIYLGTLNNGIYKSFSQGEYWHRLEDKNKVFSGTANVHEIAIDPKEPNRIYAGVYQDKKGRLFRSQDAGESWEEVYVVSEEAYAVYAVAIDNYDPSIIYMGTAQGGFLKSTDYGKSWQIVKWFDDVISDIAINPQDTRIVYVSTFKEGIYKTTDKGITWQSFQEALDPFRQSERVERIVLDPQRPQIIYAGSEYGLLVSYNSGQVWQEVKIIMPPESKPVLSLAVESQNPDHLYYGAGSILYRSFDQGKNWTVHELSSQRNVKVIAIDPKNPEIIYAGMHK